MPLPCIVIVGRPNVGKSSLLNRLARRMISIVDPTAGVTRDRIETEFEIPDSDRAGHNFRGRLIDTGGHGIIDSQNLTDEVEQQIMLALREADLVLFVIDAQEGLVALDQDMAELLRRHCGDKRIILVANKVDGEKFEAQSYEAMKLGFGEPVMVSAENGYHIQRLQDAIAAGIDWSNYDADAPAADEGIKIALVGKRNAGKSTLVNALAGRQRVIVSEQEGTTRDSVDVRIEHNGHVFTLIDTAGLRKRKSIKGDIEYYAAHRALRSIRRADVCLFLIDAAVPVSQVDQQLAGEIVKHHRPVAIVVNKWDLAEGKVQIKQKDQTAQDVYADYLDKELAGLNFAPIAFTCALDGKHAHELLPLVLSLHDQARQRVSTGVLNRAVEQVTSLRPPASRGGRQARIYYATQVAVDPPTIVLFVNDPQLFDATYQRFLLNRLRDQLPFAETPIKLIIRARSADGDHRTSQS
ncbi:MAG: ribosome biogenesis GTPase Der [Phycisphaeraceae bacterium]|nr:ribosome biogenesis GTPase Der [Phycisphaeraceae bacterium]